ncbi:unnamed protein product [Allacma fusca]|uniref:AAA+ ATPase domain-containing protein n=1 Tax=Allacma fusca TaxID=39272 RepID=A0A8J2P0U1_9HEXA|nr:unnamed protein product [Allacma fusca]
MRQLQWDVGSAQLKIKQLPSSCSFQKCLIYHKDTIKAPWNIWVGIGAKIGMLKFRVLVRLCEIRLGDVSEVVRCDLRVIQLFLDPGASVVVDGNGGDPRDKYKAEIDLAHHIIRLEGRQVSVNEYSHNVNSAMKFNDILCCTSNDIQMLASATIKTITLTVVFASENHCGTTDSRLKSHRSLLADYLRDIFLANDIRVSTRTLVDLRQCPLSQSSVSFPRINYLFVEDCCMMSAHTNMEAVGEVIGRTEILIARTHQVGYYKSLLESLKPPIVSLVGMEHPLRLVEDTVRMHNHIRVQSKQTDVGHFSAGLLIAGSASCGKTLVVREAARKLRTNLFVFDVSAESVHDAPSFLAASTAVFSQAVKEARDNSSLLLIQHLELLGTRQEKTWESSSTRIRGKLVSHLCQLLDAIPANVSLIVVVPTSRPHLLPLSFRRTGRLQQEVYLRLPSERDRFSIIQFITQQHSAFVSCDLSSLAKKTPGFTRSDLKKLIRLIILKTSERDGKMVLEEDVKYGLSRVVPTSVQGSVGLVDIQRGSSLDDIAGLHSVKLDLIKAIVWPLKNLDAFRTMGIHLPKVVPWNYYQPLLPLKSHGNFNKGFVLLAIGCILLYGPPGCAKTSIVRALAGSHDMNFLSVTAAELFSSGVGDSEKIVTDLFHRARLASPCILFVDELEAVVGSRQAKAKAANESILSCFLTEMDGVGVSMEIAASGSCSRVVVVAATNRPDLIDSALLRPGRLDRLIYVPPPNESERAEILVKCTAKMTLGVDVNLPEIARLTHLYSGADLVNLCKEAALLALAEDMDIQSVSMKHLLRAKTQSNPSISPESLKLFQEHSSVFPVD